MTNLRVIAHRLMQEAGFVPDLPPAAAAEAQRMAPWRPAPGDGRRDLRRLLWSSIDNPESRDLDQIEVSLFPLGEQQQDLIAGLQREVGIRRERESIAHNRVDDDRGRK